MRNFLVMCVFTESVCSSSLRISVFFSPKVFNVFVSLLLLKVCVHLESCLLSTISNSPLPSFILKSLCFDEEFLVDFDMLRFQGEYTRISFI